MGVRVGSGLAGGIPVTGSYPPPRHRAQYGGHGFKFDRNLLRETAFCGIGNELTHVWVLHAVEAV